MTDYFLIL